MNRNQITPDERDETLGRVLRETLPAAPTSPELRERIAQMAARADAKTRPQRSPLTRRARLGWSALAIACVLAIFAVAWPRVLTTQAMAQIESAMSDVSSAHVMSYRFVDGKRVLRDETWFQDGKWRTENHERGNVTLWINGKSWVYDAVSNVVTTANKKSPFAHPPKGFTLDDLVAGYNDSGNQTDVTLLGNSTLDGKTVKRVRLLSRSILETTDMTMWVDPQTNLPIRAEAVIKSNNGAGQARLQAVFEFNKPLAPSLFVPKFKRGARFVEQARQQGSVLANLRAGIARQKVGERTIVVRDLQVNKRGDVFLLYTAGKRPGDRFNVKGNWFGGRDWKVSLTDSLGTRYELQRDLAYDPRISDVETRPKNLFDGQILHGDWWVPDTAPAVGQTWRPRTFALRFEVSPRNLHGAEGTRFETDYSATANFRVPITQTTGTLVPPPAPAIGLMITEDQILRAESEERGELPPGTLPSPELERVLVEDQGSSDFDFAPDGATLAWGGKEGVRLFDAASGRVMAQLRGPAGNAAQGVLFSPDGRNVAAVFSAGYGQKATFAVWDRASQKQRALWEWSLSPDAPLLKSVTIAPDNRTVRGLVWTIAKRGHDKEAGDFVAQNNIAVEERDLMTGKLLSSRTLTHAGYITDAEQAEMNGGWRIVTLQTGNDGRQLTTLRVWDGRTGALLHAQSLGYLAPNHLALRGDKIALTGKVNTYTAEINKLTPRFNSGVEVRIYRASNGQLLHAWPHYVNNFGGPIAFSSDGQSIALEGADHAIAVWNARSGRVQKTLVGHYSGLSRLAFSPDGKRLISANFKGKTFEWKLD